MNFYNQSLSSILLPKKNKRSRLMDLIISLSRRELCNLTPFRLKATLNKKIKYISISNKHREIDDNTIHVRVILQFTDGVSFTQVFRALANLKLTVHVIIPANKIAYSIDHTTWGSLSLSGRPPHNYSKEELNMPESLMTLPQIMRKLAIVQQENTINEQLTTLIIQKQEAELITLRVKKNWVMQSDGQIIVQEETAPVNQMDSSDDDHDDDYWGFIAEEDARIMQS
jgi:hypothetical protein